MSNISYKNTSKVRFKISESQNYIRVYFKNFMLDFPVYIACISDIKYQLNQENGYIQEKNYPFKCYHSNDLIPPGEYNFIEIKKKKFSFFRKKAKIKN